uniref:Insulin-like growth factor-binding protein 1 n=1 Tax=Hucho hucho TaxID=62062 RepID=A0A4W5Q4Z1_9TELE
MSGSFHRNVLVAAAVCCSVLVPSVLGSPVLAQEPIRCAPCLPEKLSECPAVAPGCAEVLREPGCGCCLACAVKTGDLCGIYTAPCGSGLRCTPRPGDLRPLHSLTRGQAVCTEIPEPERNPVPQNPGISTALIVSHVAPSEMDLQNTLKTLYLSLSLSSQGPCHVELQRALEKIAKSQQKLGDKLTRFYLPNCDKHGLYKAKQCESSLDGQKGRCWCVSFWNGKKILGSTDLEGDAECSYEINH